MYLNQHEEGKPDSFRIYTFGGINRKNNGSRTEFSDMYNMSADEYPCAAPRGRRREIATAGKINTTCAPDATNVSEVTGITGVYDGGFYYNGTLKSGKFILSSDWSWQIEQKGNTYIVNGYDATNKKSLIYYYNIDTDEFDEGGKVMRDLILMSGVNTSGVSYLCTPDSDQYGVDTYQCTLPDGTVVKNSDFWLNYRDYMTYGTDGDTTMRADKNIFEKCFKVGDEITIESFPGADNGGQIWNATTSGTHPQPGITAERNNTIDTDNMLTTDSVSKHSICIARITGFGITTSARGRARHYVYFSLLNKDGEPVSFVDMHSKGCYCSGAVLKKRTRAFDNITIHHGRIWGSSPSGNQIYASASDDIFSFSSDDIVSRYAARIPSDTPGTFTALCSYNNELIAFKPDSITIVSGTNATNYTATIIDGIGCISPRSAVVTPGGIIFLSYNGFYAFSGSTPYLISDKLNTSYVDAVAGRNTDTYFASATRSDGTRELVKYNMAKDIWYKDDEVPAIDIFPFKDKMYICTDTTLYECNNPDGTSFEWYFESVPLRNYTIDNKAVCELWILADVSEGAHFKVWTQNDREEWRLHSAFSETGLKVFNCPVRAENATTYKYKISGSGKVVIHEIEIHTAEGGRRYKEQPGTTPSVKYSTY